MISYRSGARFNPDEAKYTKGIDSANEAKTSTENVNRGKQKHKKQGSGIGKEKRKKENLAPNQITQIGEKEKNSETDVEKIIVANEFEMENFSKSEYKTMDENVTRVGDDSYKEVNVAKNINVNVDEYTDTGAIPKRHNGK